MSIPFRFSDMASQLVLTRAVQARMSLVPKVLRAALGKSALFTSSCARTVLPVNSRFRRGFATSAAAAGFEPGSKPGTINGGIRTSMQTIETQLEAVSEAIKSVEEEIKRTSQDMLSSVDVHTRTFLMDKEKQLRDKEARLRDKEKQLRDERLLLLHKQPFTDAERTAFRKPFLITDSIEFTREVLTDDDGNQHAMMVAPSIPGTSVVGPVLLTEPALQKMISFMPRVGRITSHNSLIIVGPPKSSKTMMLHEVLPRLVVASKPTESPVFVRITFPLSFTPLQAWKDTRDALVDVATAYGIGALAPNDESVFSRLPAFAGFVAEGLKDQGRRLWLLIDECQAPLINAPSEKGKVDASNMYKSLIASISVHGRCGFTGSSMLTFLNSVRELHTNNFEMFNSSDYVLLGHNLPSKQWEQRVTDSFIEARKADVIASNWSRVFGVDLTTDLVLATLRSKRELFNVRPALIDQLLVNLNPDDSNSVDIRTRLTASLASMEKKLRAESMIDILFALQALKHQHSYLESWRKLSDGQVANGVEASQLYDASPDGENKSKFAAMLCGLPSWTGAVRPTLLPPYAYFCSNFISEKGGRYGLNLVRSESEGVRVTLSDRFENSLTEFGECQHLFNPQQSKAISDSVVQVLQRAGIGIRSTDGTTQPVRSMFDVPLLQQLYQLSKKKDMKTYQAQLKEHNTWVKNGSVGSPPGSNDLIGLIILRALRNLASHFSYLANAVDVLGWRPAVLESIVFAFEECAMSFKMGFRITEDLKHFVLNPNPLLRHPKKHAKRHSSSNTSRSVKP